MQPLTVSGNLGSSSGTLAGFLPVMRTFVRYVKMTELMSFYFIPWHITNDLKEMKSMTMLNDSML